MTDTTIDGAIEPATVASYLRQHPDFLVAYPELAHELVLPSTNGPASSLAVHQLRGLREKNAELETRLKELTAGGCQIKLVQVYTVARSTAVSACTPCTG